MFRLNVLLACAIFNIIMKLMLLFNTDFDNKLKRLSGWYSRVFIFKYYQEETINDLKFINFFLLNSFIFERRLMKSPTYYECLICK